MEGDGSWSPDELIANLGGDTELARQMAALFVAEAPNMLSVVRNALADGSPGTLRRAAHALKGAAGNFTPDGPTHTARLLEQAAAAGRVNEAPDLVARLENDVARLLHAMSHFT